MSEPRSNYETALRSTDRVDDRMSWYTLLGAIRGKALKLQGNWLDWVQWVIVFAAVLLGVVAMRHTRSWLVIVLSVAAIRFLLETSYRHCVLYFLRRQWAAMGVYAIHGGHIPWPAVLSCIMLPAATMHLLRRNSMMGGDSRPAILTACSLITEGNTELKEFVEPYVKARLFSANGEVPYFFGSTKTGIRSGFPSGVVPFALPFVTFSRLCGADLNNLAVQTRLEMIASAGVVAFCLGLFFLNALHLTAPAPALVATIILATGSVMYSTIGQALWQHGGVILWSLLIILLEFRRMRRSTWHATVLQGFACAMMLACRPASVTFLVPFGVWMLFRSPIRACAVVAISAVAFTPWAIAYWSDYGSIFGPSMGLKASANWQFSLSTFAGILISPGRGALLYQPWILLFVGLLVPSIRRAALVPGPMPLPAGWAWFLVSAIVLQLGLISCWKFWWGGYCWGSRLLSEVIPLIGLLSVRLIASLWRSMQGRGLVLATGLLGAAFHIPATVINSGAWSAYADVDRHPERLWSWRHPAFLFPIVRDRSYETLEAADPVQVK